MSRIDEIRARVDAARTELRNISGVDLEKPSISVSLFTSISPLCLLELRNMVSLANQDLPYLLVEIDRLIAENKELKAKQNISASNHLIEFNLESFKRRYFAILCNNEYEARQLMKYFDSNNIAWMSGDSASSHSFFEYSYERRNPICYLYSSEEGITWGTLDACSFLKIPVVGYDSFDWTENNI